MSFDFSELSDFKKDILELAENVYPKKTKKFLKNEAGKLAKVVKSNAQSEVGTSKGKKKDWEYKKSYLAGIKTGKVYKYDGADCCRVRNSSPHGHLVDDGHIQKTKDGRTVGFVPGKHILKKAEMEFNNTFAADVEGFIDEVLNEGLNK